MFTTRMRGTLVGALIVGSLSLGGAAWAAFPDPSTLELPPGYVRQDTSRAHLVTPHGMALTLGLGTAGFFSQAARDLMADRVGVYGELRAAYGTRSLLGAEVAYTLSGQGLSEKKFGDDVPVIFGHNLEGLARLSLPMDSGRLFYGPFAVVGLGWTAYVRTDEVGGRLNTRETDHVGTIPVGAGFAVGYNGGYLEARFIYRPTYGEDGFGGMPSIDGKLNSWFAGLAGGIEF
jgi:hypothetical protein